MQSEGSLSEIPLQKRITTFGEAKWNALNQPQQKLLKKACSIITYKWRWQIALNIPYLLIFIADRTSPSIHEFNMNLLTSVISKVPLPEFISSGIVSS